MTERAAGTPNLISNADLANPNCAPTYHPQFMRWPRYESPRRGGRVFGAAYIRGDSILISILIVRSLLAQRARPPLP